MSYSSKTRAPGRPGARGRGRASGAAFTAPRSTTPSFTSASHPSYRPSDVSAASVGVERMSEEGAQFFRDLVPGARGAKNTRGALGMPNHDSHTPIRDEAATGDAATHALSQRKHNNNNTRAPAGNVLPGESLGVHTREPGSRQTQDHISWVQLGLCKALVRAVTHMNFITPTPVQAAAIPYALEGRDVCARAVTGSGKTAAFLLPLLNHLLTHPPMYASMGPCGKGTQRHAPNGHYHVGHRNSSSSSHYGTDNQTIHAEGAEGDYDAGDKASRGGAAGRAFLSNRRRIRSLILVPTRELGAQCESMLRPLLRFAKTPPQVALAIGGVAPQAQEAALSAAPDIVLATPGRLVDLLYNLHTNKYTSAATGRGSLPSSSSSSSSSPRRIDLTGVEVVVLDECDKMLSATLRDQVCDIVQRIPVETRQMLLFSATMTEEVDRFAQEHLYKPRNVDVGHVALQARLRQQFVRIASTTGLRASPSSFAAPLRTADTNTHTHVNDYERLADVPKEEHISITKTRYLVALCMNYITSGRSIIFCHYRTTVHRLALLMNALKLPTCEVQGGQTQEERFAALQDFTSGRVRYLVTTDVAARGWDVPDVTTVINYDLPPTLTAYIHRVGRTARIGADGTAVSLVEDERDGAVMRKILALSGGGTSGGGKRDRRGNKSTSKDDNDDDATANNNNSNSDNTDQTDEGVSVSQDTNDEEAERDAAVNAMMQHTVASVRRRDIPAAVLQCAAAAIDAVFDHVRTQLAAEQLVAQVTQAERRLSATTSTSTASTNEGRRDAAQLPQALQQRITAAPERRWCLSRQEQQRRHEESRLAYEKEVEQTRNHFQNELATLQQEESRLGQQQRQSRRAGRERAAQAQEKVRAQRRAERAKEQSRLQAGVVKKLKQRKIREAAREKREEARLAKRGGANERRRYNERGKRTSAKKSRHRGKVKKH